MGAMQLNGLEAQPLGVGGGPGEGVDGVGHGLLAHALAELLAGARQARGAVIAALGLPFRVARAHRAHVPELGGDGAALGVHLVGHPLPAGQLLLAVEARDVAVVQRGGAVHARALCDDQTHLAGGPAAIVLGHLLGHHAVGREGPGHGGHDQAVLQVEALEGPGLEEGFCGHGRRLLDRARHARPRFRCFGATLCTVPAPASGEIPGGCGGSGDLHFGCPFAMV